MKRLKLFKCLQIYKHLRCMDVFSKRTTNKLYLLAGYDFKIRVYNLISSKQTLEKRLFEDDNWFDDVDYFYICEVKAYLNELNIPHAVVLATYDKLS